MEKLQEASKKHDFDTKNRPPLSFLAMQSKNNCYFCT